MEKTIKIDGRDVRLKATAAFPLHFNTLTGKDYFLKEEAPTQRFYDVIWVLAKCADDSIPPRDEWVESFDAFPVLDLFGEAHELIERTTTQGKNVKAATGK